MDRLYNWKIKPEAIVPVPGIVSGFTVAARAFGTPRKGILVMPPVYNEFHEVKNNVGIPQIDVPFVRSVQGKILRYEIDWDLFQKKIRKAGMFLLCSPHNPLGILFSRSDLARMAQICIENNVLIVSDEIHSELLLGGQKFFPISKLSQEVAKNTITLVAPSKTFNVPGLHCGFAIIPNKELREQYIKVTQHMRRLAGGAAHLPDWKPGFPGGLRDEVYAGCQDHPPGCDLSGLAGFFRAGVQESPV
jgi:cystathionine beta-lyase